MNRAVFLDRDGVLNEDPGYVHKLEDFKLYGDVIESLNLLKKDFKLIIITNQSGIGRGYYKEEDFHRFNDKLVEELKKNGIIIEKTYFCPHSPKEKCNCRKPNTTFIEQAKRQFNIDVRHSFVIGDHPADVKLGKNAGCKAVYLLRGHATGHLEEARGNNPDYIANSLKQAADFILFNKDKKIIKRDKLKELSENLKKENKKIVTLNGAFDILHKGHEKILKEAKAQGDVLIVGVNSDKSVKGNKGPGRPLNNEFSRAKMLANFEYVDYVTIFDEKTPIEMLEIIKPNVHVNGSEYGKDCIERETVKRYGGRIHIVKLKEGFSTTGIIAKIDNHKS
jgi:rfaE bifunctional protein nucleotidyltransferase chain/domain